MTTFETILDFFLIWFTISIVALGLFSLFTYLARRREEANLNWRASTRDGEPIFVSDKSNPERHNQLPHKIPIDPQLLGLGICIECSANITPDEQPYCTDCFERLEQDGFFD